MTKFTESQVFHSRFQILAVAGTGLAEVYRALDGDTGNEVALKVLGTGDDPNGELRARLQKEAELLQRVQHPSVVQLLDSGETAEGERYLVLEYLRGETLRSYLERQGTMPTELLTKLALDVAEGLVASHNAGIIHRDVKPDNIFLTGDVGSPDGVRVLDFGLALSDDSQEDGTNVLGTLEYMSPEQVVADPVDARSDVYGVGVVLFRAITGELPFDTKTGAPLLAHQLLSPAPPPSWLVEGLCPELETVVLTALRKHPRNRYPTMRDLADDLQRVIAGEQALGRERVRLPDIYRPRSALGQKALEVLGERHGHDVSERRSSEAVWAVPSSAPPPPLDEEEELLAKRSSG